MGGYPGDRGFIAGRILPGFHYFRVQPGANTFMVASGLAVEISFQQNTRGIAVRNCSSAIAGTIIFQQAV